jgi:hypothetical protein
VQYLKPFTVDGIEQVPIISMHFMDEGNLVAFCNMQ